MTDIPAEMTNPQFLYFEELPSTNSKIKELCDNHPLPEFSIVIARQQSAGRGQQGNHWESEPGKNLTFSIVIYPNFIKIQDQFIISQWISVAIIKTLAKYIPQGLKIKWPNDIYVNNKKLAGILIENTLKGANLERAVIGIGLNVNQEVFTSNAPNPTSLIQLTKSPTDLNALLEELLMTMSDEYSKLISGEIQLIQNDYTENLFRNDGMFHEFKDTKGMFKAMLSGIDNFGRLKLKKENGDLMTYEFKEVEYVHPIKS
jgi:BirA family biotin operon repressor/biotin-[acetyl-CoA-carboxylase] ligase